MSRLTVLLLSLLFSTGASALTWKSGVPAAATVPFPNVPGDVYYTRWDSRVPEARLPIRNCVLVHGETIAQRFIDDIFAKYGDGLLQGVNVEGLPLPPRMAKLARLNSISAFAYFLFGERLIGQLLTTSCAHIYMAVQESAQTSLLEMTRRTERFLRDVACRQDGLTPTQSGCALLGHSKGGAVATAILRRCGEAQGGESELGQAACGRLGEVYSAAGSNEGSGIAVVLLSARQTEKRKEEVAANTWIPDAAKKLFKTEEAFEDGLRRLQKLESLEDRVSVDILGEKTDKSNPYWFDQGPLAPMEKGVPLAVIHGETFVPRRIGWLRDTEYAANGTGFRFDKVEYVHGVDPKDGTKQHSLKPGQRFVRAGTLPSIPPRPRLLPGGGGGPFGGRFPALRGALEQAGGLQQILDFLWEPFVNGQMLVDGIMQQRLADFHGDPFLDSTFDQGKNEIAKTSAELAQAMKRFGLNPDVKQPGMKVAFHESDGLVELGSALGPCLRGKELADADRLVDTCTAFPDIHHLGLTGMSDEAARAIVTAFSTRRRR